VDDFLEKLARQHEPGVTRAILAAMRRLRAQVDRAQLKQIIATHSPAVVAQILVRDLEIARHLAVALQPLLDVLVRAGQAQGKRGVEVSPSQVRKEDLTFGFDLVNPKTVQAAANYRNQLIREITTSTSEAIQAVIADGLRLGAGPPDTARQLRGLLTSDDYAERTVDGVIMTLGLTERQAKAVTNYKRLLEEKSTEALARELHDRRYDRLVTGPNAPSADQVNAAVERYAERYLAYRAVTISRTETLRAANIGQDLSIRRAAEDGEFGDLEPRRFWITAGDEKVRHEHREIPRLNPDGVGLNEPFKYPGGRYIRLPGDPDVRDGSMVINCRCTVVTRLYPRDG